MITDLDIQRLDAVVDDIISRRDYYLGTFGDFVKNKLSYILAARHPQLKKNHKLGEFTRTLFRKEFMPFLIKNPELFAKRMPFPFINTLASIKAFKANREKYSITWISDLIFIETSELPLHITYQKNMQVTLNAIKNPIQGITEYQQSLLPEGYSWLSEKDVALAMLDDFNPKTLALEGNWVSLIKEKKSKQRLKKKAFIEQAAKLLSPTMLLKCMTYSIPKASEDESESRTITQSNWMDILRLSIKNIFNALDCSSREDALQCYIRIYKALAIDSSYLSRSDYAFKSKLIKAINIESKKIQELQRTHYSRINLPEDEFGRIFMQGVLNQVSKLSLDNPVYSFAKEHVLKGMKRIKRMRLSEEEKSRFKELLFHESFLIKFSKRKLTCDIFDLKSVCDDITKNSQLTLNILEDLILKNSVLKNLANNSSASKNNIFSLLNSSDEYWSISSKDYERLPYISELSRTTKYVSKIIANAFKELNQLQRKASKWNYEAINSLPDLGYFDKISLKDRLCVVDAIMSGNFSDIQHIVSNSTNTISKVNTSLCFDRGLEALNRLLSITVGAEVPESNQHNQRQLLIVLLNAFCLKGVINNFTQSFEYKFTYITLIAIATKRLRLDLVKLLNEHYDGSKERVIYEHHSYGVVSNPSKLLAKYLLNIECISTRRLFGLYAICIDDSRQVINIFDERLDDLVAQIEPTFGIALKPILRRFFKLYNKTPFEYLTECPEWHQAHVMEILSE